MEMTFPEQSFNDALQNNASQQFTALADEILEPVCFKFYWDFI